MTEEKEFKKMNKPELKQLFEETAGKVELIDSFLKEIEKIKQAVIETNEKISGEAGIVSQIEKKSQEINDFHEKQKEKYLDLYKHIEEELKAGTSSVNLSKSFADKVKEYRWNSWFWSVCFIVFLVGLVSYYGYVTFSTDEVKTAQDVWRHVGFRTPFLLFSIWLAIFFGNRRAESKKLEELYKHKEVMARSFVGYKQTLEELSKEDETLLKQHTENLLKAINENSATFLNSEGDRHPLLEAFSLFRSKKDLSKEKE